MEKRCIFSLAQENYREHYTERHDDENQQPAKPLSGRFLILLGLDNLLFGLLSVAHHICHVCIGTNKLLPLLLGIGVDLLRDLINVVH